MQKPEAAAIRQASPKSTRRKSIVCLASLGGITPHVTIGSVRLHACSGIVAPFSPFHDADASTRRGVEIDRDNYNSQARCDYESRRSKGFSIFIEECTVVQVYFCDPRSPWQCSSNENTNRFCDSISLVEQISRVSHTRSAG